jgi:hypothetical protein
MEVSMKRYISLSAALLCLGLFYACGRGYAPMPPAEEPPSTTIAEVETEPETETTELETTEATTESAATMPSTVTAVATTSKAATTAARRTVVTTAAAKVSSTAPTTPRTTTTTTTRAPASQTAAPTNPPAPVYTQADYEAIVAEVRAYAEAKTKVRFIWKPELRYDVQPVGFHDVVNLSKSSGKAFVINELKYHLDLTESHVAGGSGGVPGDAVYYDIEFFEYQGDMMFTHLYG